MLCLTSADIERLLTPALALGAVRSAMLQVSDGRTELPLRQFIAVPSTGGKLAVMPGYIADPPLFGVKLVSKFPRLPGSPHDSHIGALMVFEAADGLPVGLLEGGTLTAIRTAAASALATDVLARRDAAVHLVCGAGEQARRHVVAIAGVRRLARTLVWARERKRAETLAASFAPELAVEAVTDLGAAAAIADIVSTTTSATEPYLRGEWPRRGCHLNLVGSAVATAAEVDVEAVVRARYYVDHRPSALAQAGELHRALAAGAVADSHIIGEIGQVLSGAVPGRQSEDDITLYKSLGVIAQDLAAASLVLDLAQGQGLGQWLDLIGQSDGARLPGRGPDTGQ